MIRTGLYLTIFLYVMCSCPAFAEDATLHTFWPVLDYRASESADYRNINMLGPFLKHETKGNETEYALRPLFYRATDNEYLSETDVLYPLFGHRRDRDFRSFHILRLLSFDFGERETGSRSRFYLFPFLFYGKEEQGTYKAFFPFGGTLYNWFGRDSISFTLFPLYSRTQRGTRQIDNVLWPFFARISGENETGFKFWPVYGHSRKTGVYRKTFFLWPIFFSYSTGLDSDNPVETRAALPFYFSKQSPKRKYRSVIWPFFSRTDDYSRGYTSWDFPWPLFRITRGEKHHGNRFLPFFADETMDAKRSRWYVWPIYKIEELSTELVERRRDRVLFFLYSDTKESKWETGASLRRIHFWPLFGYERRNGVSHFHILSILEPFFPQNESIARLWAPLWRVYQQKWDQKGNRAVSFLWNLYWSEHQGDRRAWELFPLFEYRRESSDNVKFRFLKGLINYQRDGENKHLKLFYLPWGFRWADTGHADNQG